MKKLSILFLVILFISFSSCSKTEDPVDESIYYDQDDNCDNYANQPGICGDVDGRILVIPGKSYKYTFNTYKDLTPYNIEWATVNGDIKVVAGQGSTNAAFKFGKKFTTGKIAAKVYLKAKENSTYKGDVKCILMISKIE